MCVVCVARECVCCEIIIIYKREKVVCKSKTQTKVCVCVGGGGGGGGGGGVGGMSQR